MKKVIDYIKSHFLIRNLLLALVAILLLVLVANISLNIFTRHGQKYLVPDFKDISIEEAMELAKEAKLELIIDDSLYVPKMRPGIILEQNPKPESHVKSGRKIFLTINSFRPKMDVIPYVTGYSLRQAKNTLESKGFEIEKLIYRSDMATNNVLEQRWNGQEIIRGSNIKAELGSGITLVVGHDSGSPLPVVPKVIGLTLREAKSRLWEIGFNVGVVVYDPNITPEQYEDARVYRQTPDQESRNNYGSEVRLWLTLDKNRVNNSSKTADEAARVEVESLEVEDLENVSEEDMLRALGIEE